MSSITQQPPPEDPTNNGGGARNSTPVSLKKIGPWSDEEDAILADYILKNGARDWPKVSRESGLDRDNRSCRLRWVNHLSFIYLNKSSLTPAEENTMIYFHHKYKDQWSLIAQHLRGRTPLEIKHFWYARIAKCIKYNLPVYPPEIVQSPREKDDQPEQIATQLPNVMLSNTDLHFPSSLHGPLFNYAPINSDFSFEQAPTQQPIHHFPPNVEFSNSDTHFTYPLPTRPSYNYDPGNLQSNITYRPRRRRIVNPDVEWEIFLDNNLLPFNNLWP